MRSLDRRRLSLAVWALLCLSWLPLGSCDAARGGAGRGEAPVPPGIYALESVQLGGLRQWLRIAGQEAANPVLLWLHGGPGAAQMPLAHRLDRELEREFVVVHWDQRGAGKSNPWDFDESTMSFRRYLADAHELTRYLQRRLGRERLYLLGHSWGAQLGIRLAQEHPEDYLAYIGVSQVVDPRRAQRVAHAWLEGEIRRRGLGRQGARLQALGPPPYEAHADYVAFARVVDACGGGFDVGMARLTRIALGSPEYRLRDYAAWLRGSSRGSGPMWEETSDFDALREVPSLGLPVHFFNGRRDYNTPLAVLEEYFRQLEAPQGKELVVFEHSAHTPFLAEPERFLLELVRVKEQTRRTPGD